MKYLLVIAAYKDSRQKHFEEYHSPRNKQYCDIHGFKYIEITDLNEIPESCRQRKIVWWRFFLIQHWIETGFLKEGDIISQIDADICIVNAKQSFEPIEGKNFAYAVDSCNTHCMGAFSLRVCDWTRGMLDHLLDSERYAKFKDSPFWKMFQEQASWYSLAGIKDTFGKVTQIGWNHFPNMGWHSTKQNDPMYSLEELQENVEILPVEWNVTSWSGDSPYYRFPTKTGDKHDVIFRHFAGTSKWNPKWAQIPLIR